VSARTKARKRALDVLYSADVREQTIADALVAAQRLADQEPQRAGSWGYAREIVLGVQENLPEIDELIETYAQGWTITRMPAVDRALIRIGIWEVQFNPEVPDSAAIAEAVESATVHSTDDSARFINGLLARISGLKD